MSYTYGMKNAPVVGKGLGGLPKRSDVSGLFGVKKIYNAQFSVKGASGTPINHVTPMFNIDKTLVVFTQFGSAASDEFTAELTELGSGYVSFTPRGAPDVDIISLTMMELSGVKAVHNEIGRQDDGTTVYITRTNFSTSLVPFISTHRFLCKYDAPFVNCSAFNITSVTDQIASSRTAIVVDRGGSDYAGGTATTAASYLLSVVETK